MRIALGMAIAGQKMGEVPVGAVVVANDKIVGLGTTQQISDRDPSAHAEVVALRMAATELNNHRLVNTTVYVTLEPCMMCAGLMVQARIANLVYGACAPKTGVIESNGNWLDSPIHNHKIETLGGVLESECSQVLTDFFTSKRVSNQED